jgi:L-arabinose isomerase
VNFADQRIWFLTGSQGLYGDETLAQVADQSQRVVRTINASAEVPISVEWKPVLTSSDAILATMLAANADPTCVGVITWMHTFSPAKMWIKGLDALRQPMLHLHTQADVELPWSTIDMDFMNLNQAAHGDREFGYLVARLGVARKIVVGHVTNPAVTRKVGVWARAASGWSATRSMKLVRFGDNMRNVAVTEGDKTEAELVFGVSVNTWGVNDLVAAVADIPESEIDPLVAEYLDLYDVVAELRPGGDRHDSLRYGARQELAMRSFLDEHGATAFTTNFEDLGALEQLPGLAVQRLMSQGYGFGAEGDWKTAVLVRAAKAIAEGLPGGASLMEDYTYHLTPGEEKILGAHMLEICPSLTTSRPKLEVHPLSIGGRGDPVRLVFDTDPGEAVVISLTDVRNRFRLTANVVDVVPPDEPLPHLPVARAVWVPRPDFYTSAEAWLLAGGAHHTAMTTALDIEHWADYAEMARTELLVIDEHTSAGQFARTVRWNDAYNHLARGLS